MTQLFPLEIMDFESMISRAMNIEFMSHDFHYDEKTEIMESMNSWMKSMISYCDPIADA